MKLIVWFPFIFFFFNFIRKIYNKIIVKKSWDVCIPVTVWLIYEDSSTAGFFRFPTPTFASDCFQLLIVLPYFCSSVGLLQTECKTRQYYCPQKKDTSDVLPENICGRIHRGDHHLHIAVRV